MSSPSQLPIYEIEPALLSAWRSTPERRRFVIEAPTGSGKSTQLPQMLSRHGLSGGGEIVILQPRRIAARMLARRVAEEMGVRLGEEVGYQVRFENVVSSRTRIRFVTEGILLRQLMDDPTLDDVIPGCGGLTRWRISDAKRGNGNPVRANPIALRAQLLGLNGCWQG